MNPYNKDPNLLEDVLRTALRREEAPDGMADGVLARVARQESVPRAEDRNWFNLFSQPLIRWAAFATVAICLIVGSLHYRNLKRERAQGEGAKQQLMLALRIASSKLQLAKEKVQEINRPQTHPQPRPARSRS